MRRIGWIVAFIMAVASLAAPSLAARQPSGPWKVNYDYAWCLAERNYGTAAKPVMLDLVPSANGGVMRLMIVRSGYEQIAEEGATLSFEGHPDIHTYLLKYPVKRADQRVMTTNVPMKQFRAMMDAPSLIVDGQSVRESFALSQLPQVVAELDKCVANLQDYWNMGPERASRIKSAAAASDLQGVLSSDDYPGVALDRNQQGLVEMTLLIDEKGDIADCTVDQSSGAVVLDAMSCLTMENKAKFKPAIGPDGKPVRSAWSEKINWRIAG